MRDKLRVVVLGSGQMGCAIIKLLLAKRGVELVGVYVRRSQRAGTDVGRLLGLDGALDVEASDDLPAMLGRIRPHIAIQATASTIIQVADELRILLRNGVNVISIAEEMAYPAVQSPRFAAEIDRLAIANKVTLTGTGINPGFVLDLLVIALTGVCQSVAAISARRVNDLSPYGYSVLKCQGVGLTPTAFQQGVADGTIVGHIGFPESIGMIAHALGWSIEQIEQRREPIVARVGRRTPLVDIEPGFTAGCLHTAVAYSDGKAVITLSHPQQVQPELENVATGDRIEITGEPDICLSGSPEIPGGIATAALAVNTIPQLMNAAPGLKSMAELPVPGAMLGDIRTLIKDDHKGSGR